MVDVEGDPPDWYPPGESVHIPNCVYFLDGERTLLFDTLSPASTDRILTTLGELLGERELDYLVVSHPDVPHAGNTLAILEQYPDATLVAPRYGDRHELYHLDRSRKVGEGDTIDLGGLEVAFHEATFLDAPVSMWMSELTTGTLFPVDWLGFPYPESESLTPVSEVDSELSVRRLVEFHGRVMFWYQYVDVDVVEREVDHLVERFDPNAIAPAHGLVIDDAPVRAMEAVKPAVEQIVSHGRVGTLG